MSKRQKRNKLLIRQCHETVIEKTVSTFTNTDLNIYVALGHQSGEIQPVLAHRFGNEIQIVDNRNYQSGIASSIKAGLAAAGDDYDYYGFCNGDKPFINKKSIIQILKYLDENKPEILIPLYQEKSGHPTFFSKIYLSHFGKLRGDVGGKVIIDKFPDSVTYLPVDDEGIILDMDAHLTK